MSAPAPQAQDASGGTIFSLAREKMVEKRVLGERNSAYAQKARRNILRVIVPQSVKERPLGGAFNFIYGNIALR